MHLCQFLRFPAEMKIAFCNRPSMAQSHEHRIKIAAVSLVGLADVIRTAWVPFKRKANCQPLVGTLLLIAVCCQLKNISLQLSWTECSCKLKWLRVNLGLCQMMMHHTGCFQISPTHQYVRMSRCQNLCQRMETMMTSLTVKVQFSAWDQKIPPPYNLLLPPFLSSLLHKYRSEVAELEP